MIGEAAPEPRTKYPGIGVALSHSHAPSVSVCVAAGILRGTGCLRNRLQSLEGSPTKGIVLDGAATLTA